MESACDGGILRRPRGALAAMVLAAALGGCGSKDFTEAPPKGSQVATPSTPESVVSAKLALTYARLEAEANKAAPAAYDVPKRREELCVRVGPKGHGFDFTTEICQDVDYSIHVARSGAITVGKGPGGNKARITMPVHFSGQVGFTGALAKAIALDKKNFDGDFLAFVDVAADMGEDWCPIITATLGYDWQNRARIEILPSVNVDVANKVGPEIDKQLNKMRDEMVKAIDCAKVKDEVAKLWAPQAIPIAIPDNGTMYVNVEPVSIGFSGVESTATALEFAVMMAAKVAVATSALPTAVKSLPPLTRVPLAAGKITFAVPLRASYERLNTAIAQAVKDKTFSADTPAGNVTVKVEEAEIYPSNDKVAVRVKFKAQTPGSWLDTNGSVYLAGKPVVENDGTVIALTDLQFARALDSAVWSALSVVFEQNIRGAIEKAARVDLGAPIAQGRAALQTQLTELGKASGVQVTLTDTNIAAGPITPTATELVAEVRFESVASIVVAGTP